MAKYNIDWSKCEMEKPAHGCFFEEEPLRMNYEIEGIKVSLEIPYEEPEYLAKRLERVSKYLNSLKSLFEHKE